MAAAQQNPTQHNTTRQNKTQHNTPDPNTTQHKTTQHNTTQTPPVPTNKLALPRCGEGDWLRACWLFGGLAGWLAGLLWAGLGGCPPATLGSSVAVGLAGGLVRWLARWLSGCGRAGWLACFLAGLCVGWAPHLRGLGRPPPRNGVGPEGPLGPPRYSTCAVQGSRGAAWEPRVAPRVRGSPD